jgi:type III pantothenate kinase
MTLLIDIGNTALKWTLMDASGVPGVVRVERHRDGGLASRLTVAWQGVPEGSRAVACSVASADARGDAERAAATRHIRLEWLSSEVRHESAFVLVNGYRNPEQLGADRWHGMLGGCRRLLQQSFVLVAAGTATTIDCVEAGAGESRFVGGCIAPGQRLMLDALASRTAGLPLAAGSAVDFPDHTDDAIVTGILDAQAGLVERFVRRFARRLEHWPAVLLSGGDAELLAERLRGSEFGLSIEHNLVLAGLAARAGAPIPESTR